MNTSSGEDELPQRFCGQLFPDPLRPVRVETDIEILRRVRDGLIDLPAETHSPRKAFRRVPAERATGNHCPATNFGGTVKP